VSCGKESNDVLIEQQEDSEGIFVCSDSQVFSRHGLAAAIRAHGVASVAAALPDAPIYPRTLRKILTGDRPKRATTRRILTALDACPPAHGCCADGTTSTGDYEERRQRQAHTRSERRLSRFDSASHRPDERPDIAALRESLEAIPRAQLAQILGVPARWLRAGLRCLGEIPEHIRTRLAQVADAWQHEQSERVWQSYQADIQRDMTREVERQKKAARDMIYAAGRIRQPRAVDQIAQYRLWVPKHFRNGRGGGLPIDIMLREMIGLGYYADAGDENLDEFSDWLFDLVA
jgi:hypothetical protein